MEKNRWEIWEARVPYIDQNNKSSIRPVVIIEPGKVLVLKITTHGHSMNPKPYEYEIFKWEEAGLTMKSFIQCNRYIELEETSFTGRQYGKLSMVDIVGVQQMMKYHGLIR